MRLKLENTYFSESEETRQEEGHCHELSKPHWSNYLVTYTQDGILDVLWQLKPLFYHYQQPLAQTWCHDWMRPLQFHPD